MVKNGQHVSRGQTLATLDKFKLENAVTTARTSLERSKLDLTDALIGQGYDPEKRSEIPDEVMRLARLRSGVAQAEVQLREAERALDEATLRAPFDGVIANLTQKAGNSPDGSQPFCRVMSSSAMEVSFSVLESELSLVHVGDAVEVKPFSAETTYRGKVSSINPVVDKNGMVDVCATVGGSTVGLYDGMNVRVNVKREVEKALVVPKSAVVLRSNGRKVVFTYLDGKAMWNYVTTGLDNMDEYVITEGLTEGQEVIVSGNFNLAHEVPVKVVNN
jgi:RND family efflux transporter MFP subunit